MPTKQSPIFGMSLCLCDSVVFLRFSSCLCVFVVITRWRYDLKVVPYMTIQEIIA
jgi:hypothetical protein